jgi:hypothetical protein
MNASPLDLQAAITKNDKVCFHFEIGPASHQPFPTLLMEFTLRITP